MERGIEARSVWAKRSCSIRNVKNIFIAGDRQVFKEESLQIVTGRSEQDEESVLKWLSVYR